MSLVYCLLFLLLGVILSLSFYGLLELLIHILEIVTNKIMSDFACNKVKVRFARSTKKFRVVYFSLLLLGCISSIVVSFNVIKDLTSVTQAQ